MYFKCSDEFNTWSGKIINFQTRKGYYEFMIQSRTSFYTIIGSTSRGNFACFPDFNLGCHLVSLKDTFWNTEKLIELLGSVDGLTVSAALTKLSEKIEL